jgi:hypothetical protein
MPAGTDRTTVVALRDRKHAEIARLAGKPERLD